MSDMKKFSGKYRLQGHSLRELTKPLESAASDAADRNPWWSPKFGMGALLNALVVSYLAMPKEERERFTDESIEALRDLMCETDQEREAEAKRRAAGDDGQVKQTETKEVGQDKAGARKPGRRANVR